MEIFQNVAVQLNQGHHSHKKPIIEPLETQELQGIIVQLGESIESTVIVCLLNHLNLVCV